MEINGTLLIFLLSFLVFARLLDEVLWKPVSLIKEKRETEVNTALISAENKESESSILISKLQKEVAEFKEEQKRNFEQMLSSAKKKLHEEELSLKHDISLQIKKSYERLHEEQRACVDKINYNLLENVALNKIEEVLQKA